MQQNPDLVQDLTVQPGGAGESPGAARARLAREAEVANLRALIGERDRPDHGPPAHGSTRASRRTVAGIVTVALAIVLLAAGLLALVFGHHAHRRQRPAVAPVQVAPPPVAMPPATPEVEPAPVPLPPMPLPPAPPPAKVEIPAPVAPAPVPTPVKAPVSPAAVHRPPAHHGAAVSRPPAQTHPAAAATAAKQPSSESTRWIANPLHGEALRLALIEDKKQTRAANDAEAHVPVVTEAKAPLPKR